MSALNYAAGLLLFRRGLGFGVPASVAAASLVAFGARTTEPNRSPAVATVLFCAGHGVCLVPAGPRSGRWARRRGRATGCWQWPPKWRSSTGFYLGWFLLLGLGTGTVAAFALRSCRRELLDIVQRDLWAIVAAAAVGLLLLQPFLSHYLRAAQTCRVRILGVLRALHPKIWSWFNLGGGSWFWGWMEGRGPFRVLHFSTCITWGSVS